ncbi:hypothetical protein [Beijerinckia sp. L45]|uniref:hypothetical protein n=1 Tax=Beijerinckia sp. L45 TaxID=1641855 RepID=UPI00131DA36B|nr:hypothetical protein [Beijerinckia sp. L45]
MGTRRERAHFLFQAEDGAIDAPTWRRHAGWMAAALVGTTVIWRLLAPYAHHDLATSAFLAPMTILAFVYLLVFSFFVLLLAISFYFLSAKRLRDRGEPTALAGLLPFLALVSGSLHFIQPQVPDVIAIWYVIGVDILLAAVGVWMIVDLGFRDGRPTLH